jgi:DNA polymerase elongation subunit (family B)
MREFLAIDIETSGLNPNESALLAVGLADDLASVRSLTGAPEEELLDKLEYEIRGLQPGTLLLSWNGEEFDFPFLMRRYELCGVATTLELVPQGRAGKYGKERYEVRWGHLRHVDLAPVFEDWARKTNTQWSLKPVAKAWLGLRPIEVDRRGEAIAGLTKGDLTAYVESDARITLQLAESLNALYEQASHRSILSKNIDPFGVMQGLYGLLTLGANFIAKRLATGLEWLLSR